jgi:hypothetical protein
MSEGNNKIDKRAETQWRKSAISFKNYQDYIEDKKNKFQLTLIDLLYISNFKGGNATINEEAKDIEKKLKSYSKILIDIDEKFGDKRLSGINEDELDRLCSLIEKICSLTVKKSETKIDGFSVSFLSALLHGYFTNLIPILDRRILINLDLVKTDDIYKSGQIKNIFNFYKPLVFKIKELSVNNTKSIREIDKENFIIKINR